MVRYVIVIGCFFVSCGAWAQQVMDTVMLREATTVANAPVFHRVGKRTQNLDSTNASMAVGSSLADLLQKKTTGYNRNYGPSGSSGMSFRGMGANHTSVIWNGLNMQSPTLGQFDFSLLPGNLFSDVQVDYGASNTAFGSGTSGATIHLGGDDFIPQSYALAEVTALSFEGLSQVYKARQTLKSGFVEASYFQRQQKNNFPVAYFYQQTKNSYRELKEERTVEGASFRQEGATATMGLSLGKWKVKNAFLASLSSRELMNSTANQEDINLKNALTATWEKGQTSFSATYGLQYDELHYDDSASSIHSDAKINSHQMNVRGSTRLSNRNKVEAYVSERFISALLTGYNLVPQAQNRLSVYVADKHYFLPKGNLLVRLGARVEAVSDQPTVPTFSLAGEYGVNRNLTLKGNVSTLYQLPTFNDLFWEPGGNPDLKPESGMQYDLGVHYQSQSFWAEVTGFQNHINQRIVWVQGEQFWYPINQEETEAIGVELALGTKWKYNNWLVLLDANATVTRARVIRNNFGELVDPENQLVYTPQHKGNIGVKLRWKGKLELSHEFTYTGKRFINPTNDNFLPGFALVDARLNYYIKKGKVLGCLFAGANNYTNQFYMLRSGYAMPGRNYVLGFNLKINTNEKVK